MSLKNYRKYLFYLPQSVQIHHFRSHLDSFYTNGNENTDDDDIDKDELVVFLFGFCRDKKYRILLPYKPSFIATP